MAANRWALTRAFLRGEQGYAYQAALLLSHGETFLALGAAVQAATCDECHGAGYLPPVQCACCKGRGGDRYGGECPGCEGTGIKPGAECPECPECEGSGEVTK